MDSGSVAGAWLALDDSLETCGTSNTTTPSPTQVDSKRIAALHPSRRPTGKRSAGVLDWLVCNCRIGGQQQQQAPTPARAKTVSLWDGSELYWFDELPDELRFNIDVRSGYRAGMTYWQCLKSIFQYHNETGNIWSHLLPILAVVVSLCAGWLTPWPGAEWEFLQNILPIMLCFLGSVIYHTFMANHAHYKRWLFLDVCGVFILFLGGVNVVLWWGLYCYPRLRSVFLVSYYCTGAACVLAAVTAKTSLRRAAPMFMLLCIRLAAVAARLALRSGSHAGSLHYLWMEALSILGASINIARVPERWFAPAAKGKGESRIAGWFDYWFNSHQIMHILVAIAIGHLHWGASLDYRNHMMLDSCFTDAPI
ncbi:hypothetical protein WJX72_000048 [[Myrmecia] bisecta]|uniref:Progestin and adipoQ receptor family member 4 n=1 Tax=[Myrmecia] bisecta TaxID=41462 RepID=A0AAW1Q319_9CHLO